MTFRKANINTKKYYNVLGVRVNSTNYQDTIKTIDSYLSKSRGGYISVCAVHLIMECFDNSKLLKGVNRSILVVPDGMPLVWIGKYIYNEKSIRRVYGPNLALFVCNLAYRKKYNIFILGGARGQAKDVKKNLVNKFPGIKIIGTHDTPIRPIPTEQNAKLITQLKKLKPQIILSGLGCPFQEKWIIDNCNELNPNIYLGVGAAFDFLTNSIKEAPLFLQNAGLEWLYRLLQDPKRLWKRYTLTNVRFMFNLAKQLIHIP